MNTPTQWCPSCGGVIGRDCWNPGECAQITAQMAASPSPRDREATEAPVDVGELDGWAIEKLRDHLHALADETSSDMGAFAQEGGGPIPQYMRDEAAKSDRMVKAFNSLREKARQVDGLVEALKDVEHPMRVLERQAEADGCKVGAGAFMIANDAGFIRGIAKRALNALTSTTGEQGS